MHKASESADMLITIIFKQNEPRSIQSLIWLVRRSQLCETISLIPDVKTSVFIFLPSHLLVMPFKCLATWYRTLGCWLARLTLLEGGAYWTARITGRNYHAVVRRFLIKKKPNPKTEEDKILAAFWKFPEGPMSGNIIDKKGRQPTETLERRSRDGSY